MVERIEFIVIDTTHTDFPGPLRAKLRLEYEKLLSGEYVEFFSEWQDDLCRWNYSPEQSKAAYEECKRVDGHFGSFEQYESDELAETDHMLHDFLVAQGWNKEPVRILLR